MGDDFPGYMREWIEFMTYTRTVLGNIEVRIAECKASEEKIRTRVEHIELGQAASGSDKERINVLEAKNPCADCATRIAFVAFYEKEWPGIRNKVIAWAGGLTLAAFLSGILLKVLF